MHSLCGSGERIEPEINRFWRISLSHCLAGIRGVRSGTSPRLGRTPDFAHPSIDPGPEYLRKSDMDVESFVPDDWGMDV